MNPMSVVNLEGEFLVGPRPTRAHPFNPLLNAQIDIIKEAVRVTPRCEMDPGYFSLVVIAKGLLPQVHIVNAILPRERVYPKVSYEIAVEVEFGLLPNGA